MAPARASSPIEYRSADGQRRMYAADSRRLPFLATGSVAAIVTSPSYWVRGRGRASAARWARDFAPEWRRVLRRDGDLWLVIGDRHDGTEWVATDGLVVAALRGRGWTLQSRGFWGQVRSRERWDNRVNYVLRFCRPPRAVPVGSTTLFWALPLPRSHPESEWDATPEPIVRAALEASARGLVVDPFAGAGTVGLVARALGRPFVGVERDPALAELAARRLRLPVRARGR
jgi:DNA modification methylase